jgi:transcriptional regulator with XRE-family HTH domain
VDLRAVRAKIVEERDRRGFTQEDLAQRAGIDQSNYSRLEDLSREFTEVRARTIFNLIEALGMTVSSFFAQIEGLNPGVTSGDNHEPQRPNRQDGDLAPLRDEIRDSRVVLRELAAAFLRAAELQENNRATTRSLFAELAYVCRAAADARPETPAARAPRAGRRGRH